VSRTTVDACGTPSDPYRTPLSSCGTSLDACCAWPESRHTCDTLCSVSGMGCAGVRFDWAGPMRARRRAALRGLWASAVPFNHAACRRRFRVRPWSCACSVDRSKARTRPRRLRPNARSSRRAEPGRSSDEHGERALPGERRFRPQGRFELTPANRREQSVREGPGEV
jgi:hypothetical protein